MSLHSHLNRIIKERGYLSREEMEKIVRDMQFSVSNAERRLRRSESPNVTEVMGKNQRGITVIVGYRWNGEEVQQKVEKILEGLEKPVTLFSNVPQHP